jgi:hypothetical protein
MTTLFISINDDADNSLINRVYSLRIVDQYDGTKSVLVHEGIRQDIEEMAETALNPKKF